MQASAEERNSSDEAELAFSLPTGCRPSAGSCRAIPPWPRRWIRRIVRAGPEVLQVQGRLNIGRHIDACADKGATDAEVPVPPIYLIRGASRTPTGPPALVMAPSSL